VLLFANFAPVKNLEMWQDTLKVYNADASHEVNGVPQILVNGYSFAERCQRLGKAIEWIKHEMVSDINTETWPVECV